MEDRGKRKWLRGDMGCGVAAARRCAARHGRRAEPGLVGGGQGCGCGAAPFVPAAGPRPGAKAEGRACGCGPLVAAPLATAAGPRPGSEAEGRAGECGPCLLYTFDAADDPLPRVFVRASVHEHTTKQTSYSLTRTL